MSSGGVNEDVLSEVPLLSVGKIEREPLGKIHPRAFKKNQRSVNFLLLFS